MRRARGSLTVPVLLLSGLAYAYWDSKKVQPLRYHERLYELGLADEYNEETYGR